MPIAHYDASRAELEFYNASYIGGARYANPPQSSLATARIYDRQVDQSSGEIFTRLRRTFNSYLIAHPAESESEFEARANFAGYLNIVRPIVTAYAEAVTSNVDRKLGELVSFAENVDTQGTPLGEFIDGIAKIFCVYGFCFAIVDILDKAPYIITVRPSQVAWIEVNDFGRITEFAYVNQANYAQEVAPAAQKFCVRVWNKDGWSDREGIVDLAVGNLAVQRNELVAVKQGPLAPQLNGELPVVVGYYERDSSIVFPLGVSLIADTAVLARQIYNKLSWASDIHRKVGFPILTVPVEKTGGALPPDAKKEIGGDRALPYNSTTGAPSYIAPSSESSRELREHCVFLAQWAFKLLGLELAADQSTQAVSGINLRVRAREFESRAKRFANQMQRFEMKLIDLMVKLSGVSDQGVSVTYPKHFTLPDMTENIANALSVLGLKDLDVDIGPEAKLKAILQVISSGLSLSDEALSQIEAWLRANLAAVSSDKDQERKLVSLFRDLKAAQLAPPAASADPVVESDPDSSDASAEE